MNRIQNVTLRIVCNRVKTVAKRKKNISEYVLNISKNISENTDVSNSRSVEELVRFALMHRILDITEWKDKGFDPGKQFAIFVYCWLNG